MSDPVAPGQNDPSSEAPRYEPAPPEAFSAQPPYEPQTQPRDPEQAAQFAQPEFTTPQFLPLRQAPRQVRGSASAAMALGLAALVTALVAAFYAPIALILSAGLAIAAIVLGGISLARRGPRALSVTGLVAGSVTIALTVCVGMFSLGALGVQAFMGATSGATSGTAEAPDSPDTSGPQDSAGTIAWPANLASGGIMFTGDSHSSLRVVESDPLPNDSFPNVSELPTATDGSTINRIQVYLDYRCPACLMFEDTNGDTLEAAALAGAVVELQPLTFLDQLSAGSYYSSRVAGAMACMAELQPELAWNAHRALLHPDFQPAEGVEGPDNGELITRIEATAGPLNDEARSCIATEQHVVFAQALSNWISTNPVPRAQDPELRVMGTPLVVVNGVAFTGSISDADAFTKFLSQQGVELP